MNKTEIIQAIHELRELLQCEGSISSACREKAEKKLIQMIDLL